jgi:hypothetical protein
VLINTPGSRKTRLILNGLCHHWGFYFVTEPDGSGIGSCDFLEAMLLDMSFDYNRAKSQKMKNKAAMDHMKQKANHCLLQLLLARFILLKLFIQEARRIPGGLEVKNHRRAWVLLQVQPPNVFGEDIFESLTQLLRYHWSDDLKAEIKAHYHELKDILDRFINPATGELETSPFYCVIDDIQVLTSAVLESLCWKNQKRSIP